MNITKSLITAGIVITYCNFGARADDAPSAATPPQTPPQAVQKAIHFLVEDTAKWREERGCATCHHGTLTTWALTEARQQGFDVDASTLADITKWTKDAFVPRMTSVRDPRPGWRLVNTSAMYLGIMSANLPILSRDEVNKLGLHLAGHQEPDGTWERPPPENGAPPIWESPETLALLALLAWEGRQPGNPQESGIINASRDKAIAWLQKNPSTATSQALTLRLLYDVRTNGQNAKDVPAEIEALLKKQSADGGWSQTSEMSSDAYATGQALYALAEAGAKADRPEMQKAVSFLTTTQKPDGSWPMTSRNHPGVTSTRNPIRNPIPITYFGSAWATLGLVRCVPTPPDTAAKQRVAFDKVRAFHGKFERDEQAPDKPVVHVDLRYYDIDDTTAADFAKILTAFPKLSTLEFKSPKLTDAALVALTTLPQLRTLNLEATSVTDAGLTHLSSLKQLEKLNLKGTKATPAGIEALQKQLPAVKIEH